MHPASTILTPGCARPADFLGGPLHTLAESLDVREIFARISDEPAGSCCSVAVDRSFRN
jgi:hypothetical protein